MTVEVYLAEHHNIHVSHGMTPEESQQWMAEAEDYVRRENLAAEGDQTCPLPEVVENTPREELQESAA
jgi:hypothetical protein